MVLNIFRIQIQLHHLVLCGGWLQDYIAAAYFIFSADKLAERKGWHGVRLLVNTYKEAGP